MAELIADLKDQLVVGANTNTEKAKQGASTLHELSVEEREKLRAKNDQQAAPAFESAKLKANELLSKATETKNTLVSKVSKNKDGSAVDSSADGVDTSGSSSTEQSSVSRRALAKENAGKVKGELLHAKEGMAPVAGHAKERLQPEAVALKEDGRAEASHDAQVLADKAARAAEVAKAKAAAAQSATAETLQAHAGEAASVTGALRDQTAAVLRTLGDATEAITHNAHHALAAASRTNDDFPADNGMADGSATQALKATLHSTAAGYRTGRDQAAVSAGTTSEYTGKYLDVEKRAVGELGTKADRNLDPLNEEVKSAVHSNVDQAHDKHSRLVAAGTDKAHKHTDVGLDVAKETTALTRDQAHKGADHAKGIDLEEFSGINTDNAKPKHQQTGGSTIARSSGGSSAGSGDPSLTSDAYATTFDQLNQGNASGTGGYGTSSGRTGFPPSEEHARGTDYNTSSSGNSGSAGSVGSGLAGAAGAGAGALNAGATPYQPGSSGNNDSGYGATSGSGGYNSSSTGTGTSGGGAAADKGSAAVSRIEADAQRSAQEKRPVGTVADAQATTSVLGEAAKAGKEAYQNTDGRAVNTKDKGQEARSALTGAAQGLQKDVLVEGEGQPTGEGVSDSTSKATVTAAALTGAALKSAVTDYKDKKKHADETTGGEGQPSKTEVLKEKLIEQFEQKATPEQKQAVGHVTSGSSQVSERSKAQVEAAKARTADIQREARETAEIMKNESSGAAAGVKGTLNKAHKAKSDEKATKVILQSADSGAASVQRMAETLTQGLTELKDALSGGMQTGKDTAIEGINVAGQAKAGEGPAGLVVQQAQQAAGQGIAAGKAGQSKLIAATDKGREAAGTAGAGAAGAAGTASGDAQSGIAGGKDKAYDKTKQGIQTMNDPNKKAEYGDKAKQYADTGLAKAHDGIESGRGTAHSQIDTLAPKVDKHGHVLLDQGAGYAMSGLDTAAQQGHAGIERGLGLNETAAAQAQTAVDTQLAKAKAAAEAKETMVKSNVGLAADVGSVFFGKPLPGSSHQKK